MPLLGGDRLASRHEIAKLAMFARGKERVELDDVMAVVADASTLALDGLIDAAFAGRTSDLEVQFGKARTAGTSPAAEITAHQSSDFMLEWHSLTAIVRAKEGFPAGGGATRCYLRPG